MLGITVSTTTDESEVLDRMNRLRGLFAVCIIIGHCAQGYENPGLFSIFAKFLCVCVAFFFFVSACGMTISAGRKSDYFKGFLIRKCGYLIVLDVAAFIVGVVFSIACGRSTAFLNNEGNIAMCFVKSTNWYVYELAALYVLFYITFKYVSGRRWVVIGIVTVAATVAMYVLKVYEPYYTATLAFAFGIFAGEYAGKYAGLVNTKRSVLIGATAITLVLGAMCFVLPEGLMIRDLFLRNIMGIGIIMLVILVMSVVCIANPVADFLTKYSALMYVLQFVWLSITGTYQLSIYLRIVAVLILTIVSAVIIYRPMELVKKKLSSL